MSHSRRYIYMVRVDKANRHFQFVLKCALLLFGVSLSKFASATCPVPDGARIMPVTPRVAAWIFSEPRVGSDLAVNLSFTNQSRLWVYEDGNNGDYYKTCYQPARGDAAPIPGYVRKDQVQENDPQTSPGGGNCAGQTNGLSEADAESYERQARRLNVVSLNSTIRLMDPPRGFCSDTIPFGAGTQFYIRGYRDFHGQRMARVVVKSPSKGWIEGWFPAEDIDDARAEGSYCHGGACSSEAQGPFGDLGDIANHIMGPDQTGEGCRVLEQGNFDSGDLNALRACVEDLRRKIWRGSRGRRSQLLCNMRFRLSPAEQMFAAQIFATVGEGGIFMEDGDNASPKFKEMAFIQKVIQNRTEQMRSDLGNQYNELDVALEPGEFSCFNSNLFQDCMSQVLNPGVTNRTWSRRFDGAVRAFVAMRNGAVQPEPDVSRMDHYYSPRGMTEGVYSSNWRSLVRSGDIDPVTHPRNYKVPPDWDWDELTPMRRRLNFNGVAVDRDPPYLHEFYMRERGEPLNYGSRRNIIRLRRGDQCR